MTTEEMVARLEGIIEDLDDGNRAGAAWRIDLLVEQLSKIFPRHTRRRRVAVRT